MLATGPLNLERAPGKTELSRLNLRRGSYRRYSQKNANKQQKQTCFPFIPGACSLTDAHVFCSKIVVIPLINSIMSLGLCYNYN